MKREYRKFIEQKAMEKASDEDKVSDKQSFQWAQLYNLRIERLLG